MLLILRRRAYGMFRDKQILIMKYTRVIFSGALVWLFVFTTFIILAYVPGVKDSLDQQGIIAYILLIFYATVGTTVYYKTGSTTHGLFVGLIFATIALLLDVLVTVPLVEIPAGRSYASFFTSYVLWVLVAVNISTVYVYWRRNVYRKNKNFI
jgi:Family of unknown function (DUF5367)